MSKIVPSDWFSACSMTRVIGHWTAGGYSPSPIDLEHYHVLIDGVGAPHRGDHAIRDNASTVDDDYAAHTRGCNTGSIGLSACAMLSAVEEPFAAGRYPITKAQWNAFILAAVDLCRAYAIAPDRKHLLMHCEVQPFLGIEQRGKWDVSRLVFERGEWSRMTPGDELRARVKLLLG